MGIGVTHNNPGCIRAGKGYARYATLEDGYMALNSLLYRMYDRMTLKEMFAKYAPSGDGSNNPSKYAKDVLNYLRSAGYDIDFSTRLDFSDAAFRAAMTRAISLEENGKVLGGDALTERVAKAYNPDTDTRQKYSDTAARRARYSSIQMRRSGGAAPQETSGMQTSSLPGIGLWAQLAMAGHRVDLNDVLRTSGAVVFQDAPLLNTNSNERVV